MDIIYNTKYNIGETVFPIVYDNIYNDFYSTDCAWFAKHEKGLKVNKIKLKIIGDSVIETYICDHGEYRVKDIFPTQYEAIEECKIRNS